MPAGVFTIPPHLAFLDALVAGLLAGTGADPLSLSRMTILLPTRRAGRALREAFLRASAGRAMLLPRMRILGDLDGEACDFEGAELPPPVPPLRRQLLLARLVLEWGRRREEAPLLPGQAAMLAAELARFLDEAQGQGCDLATLEAVAPADYAEHWQLVLRFLSILTEFWPAVLAEEGALDPVPHRDAALETLLAAWQAKPPAHPVLAAGFTGGQPAVLHLLAALAKLPNTAIVLPGLDPMANPADWAEIAADPTHAHHEMAGLLDRLGLGPADIRPWPVPGAAMKPPRTSLVAEALRPAATTEKWRHLAGIGPDALAGLSRIDCPGPQEEAGVIALLMRECLETPGKTAALVTPDRDLARRVAAALRRWGVAIDDSAGAALNHTPPGMFLRLVLDAAASGFAPVPLLALLKHPLAGLGRAPETLRAEARAFERRILRGPRPAPGLAGLRAAAPDSGLVASLDLAFAPLTAALAAPQAGLSEIAEAHFQTAEILAGTGDESGAGRLWNGDAGEAGARFAAGLIQAAAGFPLIAGTDYPALFEALLAQEVVRPAYGGHPRLFIWGLLEARLQHADRLILGSLNEGTWPAAAEGDPWLSRPMRHRLGLLSPERQTGIAAHDFFQALGAPEVVLTRAARAGGAPTLPSRWLLRLDTALAAAGLDGNRLLAREAPLLWQAALDAPSRRRPHPAPAPRPPVSARPRRLSVTEIETWMRDPYAIYARRILNLTRLDPIDADPGAADRGQFIHAALDRFVTDFPGALPADAVAQLLRIGADCFGEALSRPGIWAFWWPRFVRIAGWFVEMETGRRPLLAESLTERCGRLEIEGPSGPFTVTGRADRIDRRRDGGLVLIDYKTGGMPSGKEIEAGYAPQLSLEAAMLAAGGFENFAAGSKTAALLYWQLSGGDPAGKERIVAEDEAAAALARDALLRLHDLVAAFDRPDTPYRAIPRPERAPRYSDYTHLARIKEWSVAGGDSE